MPEQYVVSLDGTQPNSLLEQAKNAVLVHSAPVGDDAARIKGLDYEKEVISVDDILNSFATSGYQATNLGEAGRILQRMLRWRLSDEPLTEEEQAEAANPDGSFTWSDPIVRERTRARIFLSFTSNMISSGLREAFVYLAKHRLVDAIVTTAGGIEEDFIKCGGDFVVGSFNKVKGRELRERGWNRIGNIYVPNENYVSFEQWFFPILDQCLKEQKEQGTVWTPSKMISRMGEEIKNESSLYYWCWKNDIPVFCPSFTDGSIGDMLYFHESSNPGLVVDVKYDIKRINDLALSSKKSGIIILGGGAAKHHVCNANLMRNGADFAVYINTAQEFDGCDSGASPDEAVSWGKIRADAHAVKCNCDATIAFPLLVTSVCKKEAAYRRLEVKDWHSHHANTADGYILASPWRS